MPLVDALPMNIINISTHLDENNETVTKGQNDVLMQWKLKPQLAHIKV